MVVWYNSVSSIWVFFDADPIHLCVRNFTPFSSCPAYPIQSGYLFALAIYILAMSHLDYPDRKCLILNGINNTVTTVS